MTFSPTALGIAGRVVVVTGAARGLGRAFAQGLAAGGARIVLLDVDGEGVDTAADELTRHGVEALGLHCDVAERESVDVAVARAVEAFGCITASSTTRASTRSLRRWKRTRRSGAGS